ncbi:glyoxalase-like domain protein [Arthrobacter sp. ZBG10]|uniref:VOC family protein n=1 Tax=Micrococcaceae TaxID=1268 RepID=UPI00067FCF4E|nr:MULTISPECIES: VOC family protein [Micrococcaceae]KNH19689.1 glyoxalase-like domain protein [Arthrobacter sp. ZBG10]KQR02857.1 glyoxalase-like domain protein [Arthrobacter sp. Leaf141]
MGLNIQIVIDCRNPHQLADWWAETLQWAVEPQDAAFIRSMIEQGFATGDQTITHRGNLVWKDGAAIRPPEEIASKAPTRRLLFQIGLEEKTGKNRVHWDLNLAGRDKDEVRSELETRGATFLWTASQGPHSWHTMADPEGNEFCIS